MVRDIELQGMRDHQVMTTMQDEVKIVEKTKGAYNTATFSHPDPITKVWYEGPGALSRIQNQASEDEEFGEASRVERRWALVIPITADLGIKEGMVVQVISARDPWMPRDLNITLVEGGSFGTRRRFVCKEID